MEETVDLFKFIFSDLLFYELLAFEMKNLSLFPLLFDDVLIHDKKNWRGQFASWRNQTNHLLLSYLGRSPLLGKGVDS